MQTMIIHLNNKTLVVTEDFIFIPSSQSPQSHPLSSTSAYNHPISSHIIPHPDLSHHITLQHSILDQQPWPKLLTQQSRQQQIKQKHSTQPFLLFNSGHRSTSSSITLPIVVTTNHIIFFPPIVSQHFNGTNPLVWTRISAIFGADPDFCMYSPSVVGWRTFMNRRGRYSSKQQQANETTSTLRKHCQVVVVICTKQQYNKVQHLQLVTTRACRLVVLIAMTANQ